ncbi:MAG: PaaI family thioesterase [Fimbriimonadaceae bacterium]|nr:PaaI family thioesterase [Fimbriimonadaceae bacterium]
MKVRPEEFKISDGDRSAALEKMLASLSGGMTGALGITIKEFSTELVSAEMPVDERTTQPYGIVHGGAMASLAETIASVGGLQFVEFPSQVVVGQQLSVNFLKPARTGTVRGVGRPIHRGERSQVWDVTMSTAGTVVAVARVTLAVVSK